jgi:hypothetical protein
MTKLNNVRELNIDKLDDISGGNIVIIDPGYPIASMVARSTPRPSSGPVRRGSMTTISSDTTMAARLTRKRSTASRSHHALAGPITFKLFCMAGVAAPPVIRAAVFG